MKADPGGSGTPGPLRDRGRLEFQPATYGRDTLSGTRAGGDSPRDRRPAEIGEQGLIAAERIRFFRIGLRAQAAAFEQSGDAADYSIRHSGDFRVIRRKQAVESNSAGSILGVDSVQDERMKKIFLDRSKKLIPPIPASTTEPNPNDFAAYPGYRPPFKDLARARQGLVPRMPASPRARS